MLIVVFFARGSVRNIMDVEQRILNWLLFTTLLMCASDIAACTSVGKTYAGAALVLQVSNIIYYVTITLISYFWTEYVCLKIWGIEHFRGRYSFLRSIPCLVIVVLAIINPFTGFFFSIDAENIYARSDGIIVHWLISWGYLLVITLITFIQLKKTTNPIDKSRIRPLLWFVVAPAIAALLQMMFYGLTATQCGITLSLVLIIISEQQSQISNDSLTKLNNRNAFDRYIRDTLLTGSTDMTVMMCDIDNFKKVNDTFGHAMGDNTLRNMAQILRKSCGEMSFRSFLYRYGGDEFVICGHDLKDEDILKLKNTICEKFAAEKSMNFGPLTLGISAGTARGICSSFDDVEELIKVADRNMYEEKVGKKLRE